MISPSISANKAEKEGQGFNTLAHLLAPSYYCSAGGAAYELGAVGSPELESAAADC